MCSDCCARAASGQAMADPAITLMRSRRRIAPAKGLRSAPTIAYGMRLHQGFAIGGMGSDRHFAWQQSSRPNIRFGSLADIEACPSHVRFTPKCRHGSARARCLPSAKSRHYMLLQKAVIRSPRPLCSDRARQAPTRLQPRTNCHRVLVAARGATSPP